MSMNYFPFLRGKQNELIAVRDLAAMIVGNGRVIPIIDPVNANSATRISIEHFINGGMSFLFVCNPIHGSFLSDSCERGKRERQRTSEALSSYDNWTPSLYVNERTRSSLLKSFIAKHGDNHPLALIYYGRPQGTAAREVIRNFQFQWHVLIGNRVEREYIRSLDPNSCVWVSDRFNRQIRNAEYPGREFFSDLNTLAGNPNGTHFGDFSIAGDYYTPAGGAAHAVALHHIHYISKGSRALYISHLISDRRETSIDTPGKTFEALSHLVNALPLLHPNTTQACKEYREMANDQEFRGLGYMKRLAIKHHLEIMLSGGLES